MSSIQKKLLEIQETQRFEALESFKDSNIWPQMTPEERDLFALLLIRQGAQQLAKGEGNKILDNFNLAVEVSNHSPHAYYQQGLIFASYPENSRCLQLAGQAFAHAVERDPNFFMAWYLWGRVCSAQGLLNGEMQDFTEGNQKFEKASQLLANGHIPEESQDIFYWKWGECLALLGRHSGEPIDFTHAVQRFKQAADLGCQDAQFLYEYGHVLAYLASLVDNIELYAEAARFFNQSIQKSPESAEAWHGQACCLLRLCELSIKEEYIEQAKLSFEKAVALDPENGQLWLRWAQLESTLGKQLRDPKHLELSIEKFAKADQLEPRNAIILRCWAENELFLGAHQENVDLIQLARARIIKSLELQPESPDAWYIYGSSLNELGRYFESKEFYDQAIEKFHHGLSIAAQHPLLWYGLAISYFALGDELEDTAMFEKSIVCCTRVLECGGEGFPQFWNDWGVALLKLAEMTQKSAYAESAIEKFERAFKRPLDSEYEDADLEWVYNYGCAFDLLGELTENIHHVEKAIHILNQIIQLDPNYTHARYNLALALAHLGEMNCDVDPYLKAIEHFQFLIEKDPEEDSIQMDFAVTLINLALLIQDNNNPERAKALFQQAEQYLTYAASLGNVQAFYQLACLFSLTGHPLVGMSYIERAHYFGSLPPLDDLMHDDWLEDLRQTPAFRNFLNQIASRQQSKENP